MEPITLVIALVLGLVAGVVLGTRMGKAKGAAGGADASLAEAPVGCAILELEREEVERERSKARVVESPRRGRFAHPPSRGRHRVGGRRRPIRGPVTTTYSRGPARKRAC